MQPNFLFARKNFNSRPHGGRLQCNRIFFSHGKISTHALTEGDAAGFSTSYPCFSFQLTPSRRATLRDVDKLEVQEFQLTPSRRATHSDLHSLDFLIYFNSRPHGGRQARPIFFDASRDFNSRPHGGRRGRSEMPYDNAAFQLTPSRRATQPLNERSL